MIRPFYFRFSCSCLKIPPSRISERAVKLVRFLGVAHLYLASKFGSVKPFLQGVGNKKPYFLKLSSTATVWAKKGFSSAVYFSNVYCGCIVYWSVERFSESVARNNEGGFITMGTGKSVPSKPCSAFSVSAH